MRQLSNGKYELSMDELTAYKRGNYKEFQELQKKLIRDSIVEGIECPCCDRMVKAYPRKLDTSVIKAFIKLLYLTNKTVGKKIKTIDLYEGIKNPSNNIGILKYWGLIEQSGKDKTNGKGYVSLTELGVKFYTSPMKLERVLWVFDDKVRMDLAPNDHKIEWVTIRDCFGTVNEFYDYCRDVKNSHLNYNN